MHKKAFIFDLDNTIYAVPSIGNKVFASLFDLIIRDGNHNEDIEKIKDEIMRRPFQKVAHDYHFSTGLTEKGIEILRNLTYRGKIEPFDDYKYVKMLMADKFLVTVGFMKLQQSKVDGMNLKSDFKEIHIVDPETSEKTKKDVFADIMERNKYKAGDVVIVGDDIDSEIRAAQELGADPVLYDKFNRHPGARVRKISSFKELVDMYEKE